MVDYSKWDKLELSDDSDIEVHPNVDKKSFIRWKQRDIHEKREQAKFRTAQLEVNIETNEDILIRIRKLRECGLAGHKLGLNVEEDVKLSQQGLEKTKPAKATSPEQPLYSDMIESMLMQIVAENGDPAVVLNKLKEHEDMVLTALTDERKELQKLEEEKKQHITADDIRTGWDSTIVYKSDKTPSSGEDASGSSKDTGAMTSGSDKSAATSKTTSLETLNKPVSTKPKVNEDGLEELLQQTTEFGKIPTNRMDTAFNYLIKHPFIVTEGQKDALVMSAFEHELEGNHDLARQVVWNALLIQYSATLGKDGVRLFFSRILKADHPARKAFEQDVTTTYNHISNRCKILGAEHEAEQQETETIQLHAVDPGTELIIAVPAENSEGWPIYQQFSPQVRKAIESQQLEKINEVLATLSVDDAETLVGQLSESGVLQVDNKIYDQQEWDQKKEMLTQPETGDLGPSSTIDEVD